MDLMRARLDLAYALNAGAGAPPEADRLRAARQVLMHSAAVALDIKPAGLLSFGDMIARLADASAGPARRACAVLIVDALAVPGLLTVRSSQARLDRDICRLVESALPDILRRAGYPFAGDLDAKRRSLVTLAASIDDYLRPLEPTFPSWLSGLPRDQD